MKSSPSLSNDVYEKVAETMILAVPVLLWFSFSVLVHWPIHTALTGGWTMPDWMVWLHYFIWPFFLSQWPFGRNEFLRHLRRALKSASWL